MELKYYETQPGVKYWVCMLNYGKPTKISKIIKPIYTGLKNQILLDDGRNISIVASGRGVRVFDNESECRAAFEHMLVGLNQTLYEEKDRFMYKFQTQIDNINKLLKENK